MRRRFSLLGRKGVSWLQTRRDRHEFVRLRADDPSAKDWPMGRDWFELLDRQGAAGSVGGDYFYADLIVAQDIYTRSPKRHVDVGSRIDGFVAHVASFRHIEVLDIRPGSDVIPNVKFQEVDITSGEFGGVRADSVSCLHALEHFGLGRYGDPIRPDGWLVGLNALHELTLPGGRLYLSVPTGEVQRVEFNAHRIFSLGYLRDQLAPLWEITNLAFINDNGDLLKDVDPWSAEASRGFGSRYGCSVWFLDRRF